MSLTDFRNIFQYEISCKSVQWEQRDMTKLIVDFRNFANVPKKTA